MKVPRAVRPLALRYDLDLAALAPRFRDRFVPLRRDADTDRFLAEAAHGRHGFWRTKAHRWLRRLMSDFDVNGLLDMYPLFLGSTAHWTTLLGERKVGRLLDVGAGSGNVTRTLVPCAEHVVATELSRPMARALRRIGIECHEVDVTEHELLGPHFDLVSCFNVLDRTARPRRLLERLADLLVPGGRLLIALALPYRPFYYVGATTPDPLERLSCSDASFERAVTSLIECDLEPLGLKLISLSRAPYLSFGDVQRQVYELDDAIVLMQKA